jgi:predicted SnoaL-like aldol condensation-catalyzing enzyme
MNREVIGAKLSYEHLDLANLASIAAFAESAERFWSPHYIQHSAHIPPGRDGLFDLVKSLPVTLRYENHIAAATGDFVILHVRFSGHGLPAAWVVADIVRMENGLARGALGRHPG